MDWRQSSELLTLHAEKPSYFTCGWCFSSSPTYDQTCGRNPKNTGTNDSVDNPSGLRRFGGWYWLTPSLQTMVARTLSGPELNGQTWIFQSFSKDHYCGWLRNLAPPKGRLKHVATLIKVMGCLLSIHWCRISSISSQLSGAFSESHAETQLGTWCHCQTVAPTGADGAPESGFAAVFVVLLWCFSNRGPKNPPPCHYFHHYWNVAT